jgi:glyoxylase-like metal-dependent hydrolase (beta-lactamase superfamily II)
LVWYEPPGVGSVAVEEIVPGVFELGFGYVNAFLVVDSGVTLVDSGTPKKGPRLRAAVAGAGRGRPLGDVLVTHHHVDHVGSLTDVAPDGVRVWAHPLDAQVVRGELPPPKPASRTAVDRFGVRLIERFGPKAAPARVDRELSDGQQLAVGDGFIAYHTPGHTAGHVSLLYPTKRVLFVGDAAANTLRRFGPPVGLYSEDHEEVRKSIAKLAALDFDVACFGHGGAIKGRAAARFRALADKLAG